MFRNWFGKKRVEKIDLQDVIRQMSSRYWDVELHATQPNTLVVHGKYRNYQRDFNRLFVHFLGDRKIAFKDERGRAVTHIPVIAEQKDLYIHMKNILNVV